MDSIYFSPCAAKNSARLFDSLYSSMNSITSLQVDQEGSLANWMIPGKLFVGMGGAMDICSGVKRVIVTTDHCDKHGASKIVKHCALPLTGAHCVSDIITERCYFEVTSAGLVLRELAPGYTVEDIRACTDADFIVPEHIGVME